MIINLLRKSFVLFFIALSFTGIAQKNTEPIKFGKIDMADLQMKFYAKDSTADAVVLCDYGNVFYQYNNTRGFLRMYERTRRIKIFKKSAYEWATHQISLRNATKGTGRALLAKESLDKLKASTYTLVNGKIIESKLDKSDVFEERKSEGEKLVKFTLPNVEEGSIIEYTYTLSSDFNYIPEWSFQKLIPVAWSEYRVSIPEYYIFRLQFQGYEDMTVNEQTVGNVDYRVTSHSEQEDDGGSGALVNRSAASSETVSMHTTDYRWVLKDAPAIRHEAFITTIDDYVDNVEFDLASVRLRYAAPQNFSVTWGDLSNDLMKSENFGNQLSHFGFLKDAATNIKNKTKDTLARISLAYNFVRENIKWNEKFGIYADSKVKTAFEDKIGNDADINLMLVNLLRELDLNANPVILSTRSHGRMLESYLLLTKFNYTIAQVTVGGKDMLLDATDPLVKPGMLPMRCLNGIGRVITPKPENGRWVSLNPVEKDSKTSLLNLTLNDKSEAVGTWDIYHSGYSALEERQKISKDGRGKYIQQLKESSTGLETVAIENLDDLSQALALKTEIKTENIGQVANGHIYFSPMHFDPQKKNPFLLTTRKYPVDLGAPIDETFKATYTLPQGYAVEELPKSMKMTLPEDGGSFNFLVSATADGKIMVSSKFILKKPIYYAEEYDGLKQFFEKIIAKHAEQIVLKKI